MRQPDFKLFSATACPAWQYVGLPRMIRVLGETQRQLAISYHGKQVFVAQIMAVALEQGCKLIGP